MHLQLTGTSMRYLPHFDAEPPQEFNVSFMSRVDVHEQPCCNRGALFRTPLGVHSYSLGSPWCDHLSTLRFCLGVRGLGARGITLSGRERLAGGDALVAHWPDSSIIGKNAVIVRCAFTFGFGGFWRGEGWISTMSSELSSWGSIILALCGMLRSLGEDFRDYRGT